MSMEEYRNTELKRAKVSKEYLLGLIPMLKKAKAAELHITYNGSGDSGQIEDIQAVREGVDNVELPTLDKDKVGNAAENILAGQDIDWYNNEGGFGVVRVMVKSKKIIIDHNARFSDSEASEHIIE